jgi:UDP-N-acetylmuramoyl-tripeptide--D-alanyl-D-alanine ligase
VVDRGIAGTTAHVVTPRGATDIDVPLIGLGNLSNVLAATAVAIEFDVPVASIAELAPTLRPAAHRGEVLKLPGGATVIDDSYNANPTATRRALDVVGGSPARRRIAVLGEMLELGRYAVELHEGVGRAAVVAGVDLLIAVGGPPAAALAHAAAAAGLGPARAIHVATSAEAADRIAATVAEGDVILVKGSRGVGMDYVVERLTGKRG